MIEEAWDLPALREHYEPFIEDFAPARPRSGGGDVRDPDRDRARVAALPVHRSRPAGRSAARATGRAGARTSSSATATSAGRPPAQQHFDELTTHERPQAHLRRLRRRHDRDEARPTAATRRSPGHLERADPQTARSSTRATCRSSSIAEYEPLLDSANARPADWLRIARDIAEHRHSYDGFVVLHGTDTMAYTASALAFLLRGLGKPVVVTGSQIPLGVLRSDGRQNLLTSVLVAARDDVREVVPRVRLADPRAAAAR